MEDKLCIIFCNSLLPEVSHLLQNGSYPDVILKGFPVYCTSGVVTNDVILELVSKDMNDFSKIIVITSSCRGVKSLNSDLPSKVEIIHLEQCLEVLYSLPSIYHFIKQGNYLVTNGWLRNYRQHIREWGFDPASAKAFFRESVKKILLLETGLPGDYRSALEAISEYMGVPFDIFPVGNSHLQLFIDALIFKWRAEVERTSLNDRIAGITRESADYSLVFSQLKKMIDLTDENQIGKEIAFLSDILFMPQEISFQRIYSGKTEEVVYFKKAVDPSLINSNNSFVINIEHRNELLGVFKISGVQFYQYMSQYKAMKQIIGQIGGLSIVNARKYSELELANQNIKVSEERFKSVISQSPSVIEMYDLEGFQRSVNKAYEDLWGFPSSHTVNKFNILKSEEVKRSGLIDYVLRAYNGESVQVPEYSFDPTGKTEAKGKGRKRWLSTRIYPLKDGNGQVQSVIVSHEDITDEKESAIKLAERNQKFKNLSQSATEMLSLDTTEDVYEYLSSALYQQYPRSIVLFVTIDEEKQTTSLFKIHGVSQKLINKTNTLAGFNVLNKSYKLTPLHLSIFKTGEFHHFTQGLSEFIGFEFPKGPAKILEKLFGIHHIYTIGINKGDKLFAAIHIFKRDKEPISDSEYIELFVKQAGIVFEKKQAESGLRSSEAELRELNAQKDKFFSIIAHDLKSPFNSIIGFSELMVENVKEKDYDGVGKYAGIILQSSHRAMDLLMNLMEWSRSQTGRMEFNPEHFDLTEFIHEITLLFDDIAGQKGILIKKQLPPTEPVLADHAMIHTVLRNLISNAIKFTNPGGEIVVSVTKAKGEITVSVKDNGLGIPKESINKLFRIDENYSTPGTANEKGTGLGLILCKEFIEKHSGRIWVESEVGKGSTFCFALKMAKTHDDRIT